MIRFDFQVPGPQLVPAWYQCLSRVPVIFQGLSVIIGRVIDILTGSPAFCFPRLLPLLAGAATTGQWDRGDLARCIPGASLSRMERRDT